MTNKEAERKLRNKSSIGLKLLLTPEIGVLLPILVLCIITASLNKTFLTWKYFSTILTGSIFIGAAALGEALIIMVGEIDLSIGMNGCLAGIMMGVACQKWGLPLIPCLCICLLSGALIGMINGLCVTRFHLSSWITTLVTQYLCQGLAVTICQGVPLSIKALGTSAFTRAKPLRLSWLFFIFIALILILDFVIRRTKFGYQLRAVGGNKDSAEMAGIDVRKIKMMVFILAGILAATGGMFDVLKNATANSNFGGGREFRAIICCAVGGISMTGGAGSMFGVALGVLLFHTLWDCLRLLNVDTNLQLVLIGAILVLAVLMDLQRKKLEKRELTRM